MRSPALSSALCPGLVRAQGTGKGQRPLRSDQCSGRESVLKILAPLSVAAALAACAPSDQADSGDSDFAPSNSSVGTVPDGAPGQGAGSVMTDGETSTRGAVQAQDAPTATRGSSAPGAAKQDESGR